MEICAPTPWSGCSPTPQPKGRTPDSQRSLESGFRAREAPGTKACRIGAEHAAQASAIPKGMRPPIVIGSSPSAGSTLLRVIMGRDPSICTGGELAVMDRARLFDVDRRALHQNIERWLDGGFPPDFVTGHFGVFARLDEWGWERSELIE